MSMAISRRQLLALTLATGLIGVAGETGSWWARPPDSPYNVLDDEAAEFVKALAEAAFPATSLIPASGGDMALERYFDVLLGHMPTAQAKEIRLLLHALDAWGLNAGQAFRSLPMNERQQIVQAWTSHPVHEVRMASTGILVLLSNGYALHPEATAHFETLHACGFGP